MFDRIFFGMLILLKIFINVFVIVFVLMFFNVVVFGYLEL